MRKFRGAIYFSALVLCIASVNAMAQTDVAASVYGAFNSSSQASANNTGDSPSNAAGVLLELRHIKNPLVGFEATYAYNRADRKYSRVLFCPAEGVCGPYEAEVPADAHEITGDWIASLKVGNLRPFALAGGGLLLNVPTSGTATSQSANCNVSPCQTENVSTPTQTQTTAVFVYGAGLDWTVLPHLGLRFQYRGNVYRAPDLVTSFSSTNGFTHSAEPMIGAFFRF